LNGGHDYLILVVSLTWGYGPGARDILGEMWSGVLRDWESNKIVSIFEGPYFEAFKKTATTLKQWYDAGYINRNVFANNLMSTDVFVEGKTAACYGNTTSMQAPMGAAIAKGYEVEIIPSFSAKGTCPAPVYLCNGFAVAASSKNMERTMMAMDLIMDDESYNFLVYFGVEGKNWILQDGKIALPAGITPETTTYPWDAAGFWFTNTAQFKPLASWTPKYIAHREDCVKNAVASSLFAWSLDQETVKTEIANIKDVWVQYGNPIMVGAIADVDSALATLKEKLR
jgi:putative aldouronate transport system substrate-binding protein